MYGGRETLVATKWIKSLLKQGSYIDAVRKRYVAGKYLIEHTNLSDEEKRSICKNLLTEKGDASTVCENKLKYAVETYILLKSFSLLGLKQESKQVLVEKDSGSSKFDEMMKTIKDMKTYPSPMDMKYRQWWNGFKKYKKHKTSQTNAAYIAEFETDHPDTVRL